MPINFTWWIQTWGLENIKRKNICATSIISFTMKCTTNRIQLTSTDKSQMKQQLKQKSKLITSNTACRTILCWHIHVKIERREKPACEHTDMELGPGWFLANWSTSDTFWRPGVACGQVSVPCHHRSHCTKPEWLCPGEQIEELSRSRTLKFTIN